MTTKTNEIRGKVSVETENIFPIIKKWLYSEKDIFIRELISNSNDAITKLKKIALTEQFEGGINYKIKLYFDKEKRTLSIEDNGIGMTQEEVHKYINQIAFSGAEEFVKNLKDKTEKTEIIGHFGLGFYSSFMVSKKVTIETLSYKKDSKAVLWESKDGIEFSIVETDRKERGTKVTLDLDEDSGQYLDEWKLKELVKKYCDFLPVSIFVKEEQANKQNPIWTKSPSKLKKEDYNEFYNYLFPFSSETLFWVHLNVDYPFRFQGILYFPKIQHEFDVKQNGIKLYCNHVFVGDEANELVPQFLTILKGTIDIPDLPLNVSRSYLQNDPLVKKISNHIIKKVADKIRGEYKTDTQKFEKDWEHIAPFLKYGMMTEEKFYEIAKDLVFFQTTKDRFIKLEQYCEENKENKKIYYIPENDKNSSYLELFKSQNLEAIIIDDRIDIHFIQFLERKNSDMQFERVDAALSEKLVDKNVNKIVDKDNKTEDDKILSFFKKAIQKEGLEIKVDNLKSDSVPAFILLPEHVRRMTEMNMMKQNTGDILKNHTLFVNAQSNLIRKIVKLSPFSEEKASDLAHGIYDLALISSKTMLEKDFGSYSTRMTKLLEKLIS